MLYGILWGDFITLIWSQHSENSCYLTMGAQPLHRVLQQHICCPREDSLQVN